MQSNDGIFIFFFDVLSIYVCHFYANNLNVSDEQSKRLAECLTTRVWTLTNPRDYDVILKHSQNGSKSVFSRQNCIWEIWKTGWKWFTAPYFLLLLSFFKFHFPYSVEYSFYQNRNTFPRHWILTFFIHFYEKAFTSPLAFFAWRSPQKSVKYKQPQLVKNLFDSFHKSHITFIIIICVYALLWTFSPINLNVTWKMKKRISVK